jgi:hypothetical protein
MTLNEMKLRLHKPSATFPPTITTFCAVDEGLRISPNSLKTWWPGTELNRRRQPFQGRLPNRPSGLESADVTEGNDFMLVAI